MYKVELGKAYKLAGDMTLDSILRDKVKKIINEGLKNCSDGYIKLNSKEELQIFNNIRITKFELYSLLFKLEIQDFERSKSRNLLPDTIVNIDNHYKTAKLRKIIHEIERHPQNKISIQLNRLPRNIQKVFKDKYIIKE